MRDAIGRIGPWAAVAGAAVLILVVACDQEWPSDMTDVFVDTGPSDAPADTIVADTPGDVPPDTVEEETVEPCEYPAGTYSFTREGDLVGPATWPSCIKASGETYPLDHADFEQFYCDPAVESIIVFAATVS
jgi:hypothetical protein